MATPERASATQPTSPLATPPSPLVEQQDAIASSQTTPVIPLERLLVTNEQLAILNGESEHRKEANALVRQVARDSLTVLYPDISASTESLPQAPQAGDKIVIFTESRLEQECSGCTAEVAIGPDDIENIILRLHGPEATGQISPEQLTSLTFSELVEVLDSDASTEEADDADDTITTLLPTPTPEAPAAADTDNTELDGEDDEAAEPIDRSMQIEQDIDAADWLIFAMLDVDPAIYASDAVKRFLRERSEEIEGKKIVVLALQAPYFLDATEISSLSGYLGAYSQSASFLENAVDAIFRSYTPYGSPPVSVSGTRFANLQERLHPDPLQVLGLKVLAEDLEIQRFDDDANSGIQPAIPVGSTIRIEVGPVLDRNGQTVPDDTLVYYQLIYQGEELALPVQSANTRNGMAVRDVTIEQEGTLLITASAGAATSGEPYELLAKNVDTAEGGDAATGETATSSESERGRPYCPGTGYDGG